MDAMTAVGTGRYLYAFVRSEDVSRILENDLRGLEDCSLEAETVGGLGVLTSRIENRTIRPRRKLLAAHQRVVTEVANHVGMLPVSFGVIADGPEELAHLLETHQEQLQSALQRVSGRFEMSLTMRWAVDDVFAHLVQFDPDLQNAREVIARGQASREQMIDVGRKFESLLQAQRGRHREAIQKTLTEAACEISWQEPRKENEIARLACLIERDAESKFEEAIHQLASLYDDKIGLDFSGPWPPYSFVDLKLTLGES
jgi:hypothetical protein